VFRFDRLITVGLMDPALRILRAFGRRETNPVVPILMYHSITDDPEPGVSPYFRLNTPPAVFRAHLQLLRDEGYTVLTLRDTINWMEALHVGESSFIDFASAPSKVAAITFDDGFDDFRTAAWPILMEFGFTATMFLPTASIGWERRAFKGRDCLTWDDVQRLHAAGIEFGSHTVNHPKLWELDEDCLVRELTESRQAIEQVIGESANTFAHPYAFPRTDKRYVSRFRKAVSAAGYRCAVTTSLGRARFSDDLLTLKRLPVNGADDRSLLRSKLAGAYDWVSLPQFLLKKVKSTIRFGAPRAEIPEYTTSL
jgi:peptidoglycan/xylan/chitin deacetylase (PgdA/CDA1 family)